MADLPVARRFNVQPPEKVLRLHQEIKIQEAKSRVSRLKQDIEDLQNGRLKELQSELAMWELELKERQENLKALNV